MGPFFARVLVAREAHASPDSNQVAYTKENHATDPKQDANADLRQAAHAWLCEVHKCCHEADDKAAEAPN
jgi:hypothetical protein